MKNSEFEENKEIYRFLYGDKWEEKLKEDYLLRIESNKACYRWKKFVAERKYFNRDGYMTDEEYNNLLKKYDKKADELSRRLDLIDVALKDDDRDD
jgi:hypothetical protein